VSPLYNFQPLLTRAEVYKVSVCHYFNPKKAQEQLEYFPIVGPQVAMDKVVQYWQFQEHQLMQKQKSQEMFLLSAMYPLLAVSVVLILYFLIN